MGSSTTSTSSNNTINTSTDSANTVATLITVTDGDCDCDDEADMEPEVKTFTSSLHRAEDLLTDDIFNSPSPSPPPPPTPLLGACHRETRFLFARSEDLDSPPVPAPVHVPLPSVVLRRASSVSSAAGVVTSAKVTVHRAVGDDDAPKLHRRSTRGSRSKRRNSSKTATPPPDLRVDFFLEQAPLDVGQKAPGGDAEPPAAISSGPTPPVVNTTTNPLGIVTTRHPLQQSTAIVVQSQGGGSPTVQTVLLKDPKKQREDNMKQLLDVANTLTLQELHDFEMRYGSPHHSRSQSVKTPGSGRPTYLSLPQQRSRVASMPNTGVEEEYYRLRHFSITGKGVVNRGDSLKSRRSRSNNSVTSSNSSHSTEHLTAAQCGGGSARTSATASLASSRESSGASPPIPLRVIMLGGAGVGKSSLVSQFMTSEYLHAYDTSLDDEFGEKSVSVLLDGEESELTFIDHPYSEMSPENCITTYDPHAYCVVYSTADRTSLRTAEEILQCLWKSDSVSAKAVILVANKTDLVRSRVVSTEEGKNMATSYDCKFIETSVGINHNVDELLVGLLTQIRLKREHPERVRDLLRKRSSRRSPGGSSCGSAGSTGTGSGSGTGSGTGSGSGKPYRGARTSTSLKVKGLLGRVWARDSKSKSCENLHVL